MLQAVHGGSCRFGNSKTMYLAFSTVDEGLLCPKHRPIPLTLAA